VPQRGVDGGALDLLHGLAHAEGQRVAIARGRAPQGGGLLDGCRQVRQAQGVAGAQHHGALHGVLELAHVAREAPRRQRLQGARLKALHALAVPQR
jgi:hypothetical protein